MARPRTELQTILEGISDNVYFQPPTNTVIAYPCIIYQRGTNRADYADDTTYRYHKQYEVTVIDRDPDSILPDQVAALPLCSHERFFIADSLNHDVYNLFF